MGKESKKKKSGYLYVLTDPLCCTLETNRTLEIHYSSIKILKKAKILTEIQGPHSFLSPSPLVSTIPAMPASCCPCPGPPPPSPALQRTSIPCRVPPHRLCGSAHVPPPSLPFLSAPQSPAPPPPPLTGLYLYHLLLSHL